MPCRLYNLYVAPLISYEKIRFLNGSFLKQDAGLVGYWCNIRSNSCSFASDAVCCYFCEDWCFRSFVYGDLFS